MNKLEKLTAYLPYNPDCNDYGYDKPLQYSFDVHDIDYVILKLKPITDIDFTHYIEQNENDKVKLSDAVTDFIYRYESCPDNLLVEHFKSCPYCLMQWLLSEHYDVFGMIASDDAIEKK
jgi:hypothetical protein